MPVIIKRPVAENDLFEIWDYIADDSAARASAFVREIHQKFSTLASNPGLGRIRDDLAEGLRSFPIGRYVIFYRGIAEGIEIVRVLHGSRDMENIFH